MPFMQKGSCLHIMRQLKKLVNGEGLREEWLAHILAEVVKGLSYMHENDQIHRYCFVC